MENLELYNAVRSVPAEAIKPILGGKLKGKSDINPMWRIKALTEQFGPCGKGWKTEIERVIIEEGANGEKVVIILINLYVKFKSETEWSAPIFGIGGNTLIQTEKGQLVTNDEAYKMAYTDALSVACKALGFAADVYFEKDKTKYGEMGTESNTSTSASSETVRQSAKSQARQIQELIRGTGIEPKAVTEWIKTNFGTEIKVNDLDDEQFTKLYSAIERSIKGE